MASVTLEVSWDYWVVGLSYVISVFGSWTSLVVIDNACVTHGTEQVVSVIVSAISFGACAIWSMHFTGMLAMDIGSPVRYSAPLSIVSVLNSILFCFFGTWRTVQLTQARQKAGKAFRGDVLLGKLLVAGLWTGFGVAGMHYVGMYSMVMESDVSMSFDVIMVFLSVLIAIGATSASFAIFHYSSKVYEQVISAFVMGGAICGMHYTGMAACIFSKEKTSGPKLPNETSFDERGLVLTICLVNCCFCFGTMGFLAMRLQASKRNLLRLVAERTSELQEEKERADALLFSLLPRHVAEVLKVGAVPPSKTFDAASVLFLDIAGFTGICSKSTPAQIVDLLNMVFGVCDKLIHVHGITKVDMIGDCLVACSGVMEDEGKEHAVRLVDFALDALDGIAQIDLSGQNVTTVQARIGICSGPLATGVVGLEMPHFSVFGDTVNVAARMEQTSLPGRIHYYGPDPELFILKKCFHITEREQVQIKGKETDLLKTFWIDGRLVDHKPTMLSAAKLRDRQFNSLIGLRRIPRNVSREQSGLMEKLVVDAKTLFAKRLVDSSSDLSI